MPFVVTIEDVSPGERFDGLPWSSAEIYESPATDGTFTLIDTKTLSPLDSDPTNPASRSFTTVNATLTNGFYRIKFKDTSGNSQWTTTIGVVSALLTVDEYKLAAGIGLNDDRKDSAIAMALEGATMAVINYTERDFGSPLVTEDRLFEYDGSGYLDIDDAATVTAVSFTVPGATDVALDATYQWRAEPLRTARTPVFTYILIPVVGPWGYSSEMGFTRNLDVLAREGRSPACLPTQVKVSATWGWPTVPADVKQAIIWTIQDWMSRSDGEGLQSEAIESYSRSWGRGGTVNAGIAVPGRARDILAQYQRIYV